MDDDMESVLTDLSSELATNKDYPSTSELSEPPELNPISNEDDTNSLTSEDEDHDSDSMDLSEEDLPLSSHIWTKKRSNDNLTVIVTVTGNAPSLRYKQRLVGPRITRYRVAFRNFLGGNRLSYVTREGYFPTYRITITRYPVTGSRYVTKIRPDIVTPIDAHEHSTFAINKELDNSTRQNKRELTDYGHVHTFDKALTEDQQSLIIADIHFTGLLKLEDDKRNDLNFILAFLQECKKFVNVVGSEVQSCSGSMWAIGWQKSMTKLEIVEQYVNTETIKKNQEAFDQHVQDSDKVSEILWKLFHKIGNVALLANQQFMVGHNLPAFSDSQIPGRNSGSSKDFFSTNLTFTSHGFSNHPHKDTSDEPKIPFAFLLVIPTRKSTGQVALEIKGYNGQMVL
ncbi:hypothetical protein PSTT_13530 [Puccinia striiformis]|uniref:Tet-like 2OG-Fe(II) oxygenase domain-containing protein n=1 Tax=Puccinia striiformis TaxID=27350 RepID=A0A2S4UR99_9BASI|nr:hypothetical protein PSTT_13530 [Puccinia striiformis]